MRLHHAEQPDFSDIDRAIEGRAREERRFDSDGLGYAGLMTGCDQGTTGKADGPSEVDVGQTAIRKRYKAQCWAGSFVEGAPWTNSEPPFF